MTEIYKGPDGRRALSVKRVKYPFLRVRQSFIIHVVVGAHLYWGGSWGSMWLGYHRLCGGNTSPSDDVQLLADIPPYMRMCRTCMKKVRTQEKRKNEV